jgi:uncharacterized membrane protein YkoI
MSKIKIMATGVAGVAAGLMVSASAFALSTNPEGRAQVEAFILNPPKVSLPKAVRSAEAKLPGKLLDIRFVEQHGQPQYDATVLSKDKPMAVTIDATTGAASAPSAVSGELASVVQSEQQLAEKLNKPSWSLQRAIRDAESHHRGKPIDAWMTEHNGDPAYAIGVVRAKQLQTVIVDPVTGAVAWQVSGTPMSPANAALARRATPGDRKVTALNLLEAKGYRDFTAVRTDGASFDVDAMRHGQKVTAVVNPDTGQISTRS